MKTPCFILTIIGFIAFISCNNESESSFATRKGYSRNENLKGDIASVIVSHYNLENKFGEEQQGELKIEEQFIFNDAGNVIEEITYNPNGNPGYKYSTVKRVYNEKNDLIKKIEHSEDTTYKKETRYLYDSKGKRIEERSSDYFIVSTGEYIETLNYVKKHNYNSLGKISEISSYKSSGDLVTKTLYTYNNKGNLVECREYDSKDKLNYMYTFCYDRKGNRIEEAKYDSEEVLIENRCILYKKGLPIEAHIYSYGELTRKVVSKYENGNAIEEINFLANGDIECVFACVYDDMGNLIEQKLYEGNIKQPAELTIWNIEYR